MRGDDPGEHLVDGRVGHPVEPERFLRQQNGVADVGRGIAELLRGRCQPVGTVASARWLRPTNARPPTTTGSPTSCAAATQFAAPMRLTGSVHDRASTSMSRISSRRRRWSAGMDGPSP